MIKVENLHKSFGELEVLKGVSEHIKKGEVVRANNADDLRRWAKEIFDLEVEGK